MPKAIVTPDQDAIVSEIEIAAPAARVFQALTKSDELSRWFSSPDCPLKFWKMDARSGGHYHYATEKGTVVVNGVSEFVCQGEILEYDPPRVLVYSEPRASEPKTKRSRRVIALDAGTVAALRALG